jgi:hypothetical protein
VGPRQPGGARLRDLAGVRRLGYQLWDAWIVVAIVLWLVQGAFGSQLSQGYKRMADGAVAQRPALSAHVVATAAVALLLVDMIWKPGA